MITRESVSRIQGDQQFGFKHGLIHDVAYATLPRAARRKRHAAVARFLDATTAVGQSPEALAHHWQEAGENQRAVDCLIVAADKAGRSWAKAHALALYTAVLQILPEGDERRSEIRLRQAVLVQALSHLQQRDVGEAP
jgi:predicted ATPase